MYIDLPSEEALPSCPRYAQVPLVIRLLLTLSQACIKAGFHCSAFGREGTALNSAVIPKMLVKTHLKGRRKRLQSLGTQC